MWYDAIKLTTVPKGILSQQSAAIVAQKLTGAHMISASSKSPESAAGQNGYGPTGKYIYVPAVWTTSSGDQVTDGFAGKFAPRVAGSNTIRDDFNYAQGNTLAQADANWKAVNAAYASANGLDPSKHYMVGQFNDPNGTPTTDLVFVLYTEDSGTLTPIKIIVFHASSSGALLKNFVIQVGAMIATAVSLGSAAAALPGLTVDQTIAVQATVQVAAKGGAPGASLIGVIIGAISSPVDTINVLSLDETPSMDDLVPDAFADDAADIGGTTMADTPFNGFDFSSGESSVSFGDASVTDFGLGTIDPLQTDPTEIAGFPSSIIPVGDTNLAPVPAFDFNSTPEIVTNDFGTTFDGPVADAGASGGSDWSLKEVDPSTNTNPALVAGLAGKPGSAAIAVIAAGSAIAKSTVGQPATTKPAPSSNDILSTVSNAVGGVMQQLTTDQAKTYTGQLGGTQSGTINFNNLALIGGALLVVALVLHFGD